VSWRLLYAKQARKDARKLAAAGLKPKAEEPLAVLEAEPFQSPPPFEKLVGDLSGACSRRVTIHHRLVYQVLVDEHAVKVLRMWTHYD
jgi:Txe/YoeB family toxin of toxin-antitoxin system